MPERCSYSGKTIYRRSGDAWRVVRAQQRWEWRKTHKNPPPEVRPYRCHFCGTWHLGTHHPQKAPPARWRAQFLALDEEIEE